MGPNLFVHLFLTGLVPVSVSHLRTVPHKYDLIMTSMTWPVAQDYCRGKYTDLATILSDTDWLRFNKKVISKGLTSSAWSGLYIDMSSWRLVLNNLPLKNVTFTNWYPGEPNNYWRQEQCVIIAAYNKWYDFYCSALRPFICYDAKFSGAAKYIGISSPQLSWPDARAYCQTHHTDLAISLNSSDDNMLVNIKVVQGDSWIGLYRDPDIWKWSDGTSALNIPWASGQPDHYYYSENCAVIYNGKFYDEQCTNLHYFFCHTDFPKRSQIMRLQVKSDGSVFDPAVQSSILEQIKQKLKGITMSESITMTWKVQPDRTIFHKKQIITSN